VRQPESCSNKTCSRFELVTDNGIRSDPVKDSWTARAKLICQSSAI
jgi:hypothetical protein